MGNKTMNVRKTLAALAGSVALTVGVNARWVGFDILVSGDATSSAEPASLWVGHSSDGLRLTLEGTGLTSPETVKTRRLHLPAGVSFTHSARSGSFDNPTISGTGSMNGLVGLGYEDGLPALTAVPEPRTYALLFGAGVLGYAIVRRRLGRWR